MKSRIGFNKKTTLSLSLIIAMATSACKEEAPLASANPVTSNSTSLIGACEAPAPTLSIVGPHVQATLSQAACAQLQACLLPTAWQSLTPSSYIPGIDIVIAFDVTGSMSPYIQAMIANIKQLMDNLSELSPSVRIGLVSFRDFGDRSGQSSDIAYKFHSALTSDVALIKNHLSGLKASGGGDIPESLATAVKAAVDGKGMAGYFSDSNLEWQDDPGRIKIMLGITDAKNRDSNLPAGAPTLQETAELLKSQGILFLGIGRKIQTTSLPGTSGVVAISEDGRALTSETVKTESTATSTGTTGISSKTSTTSTIVDLTSYNDLAFLARETGAIVAEPGIDLDGDGKVDRFGEVKPGEPAVLLMNSSGKLEGSGDNADPTRVLADAITLMVKRVQPFQFRLTIGSGGRVYKPSENLVSVPPSTASPMCFSLVEIDPVDTDAAKCGTTTDLFVSAIEDTKGTQVDPDHIKVNLNVDLTCADTSTSPAPKDDGQSNVKPPPKWYIPPGVIDEDQDGIDDVTGEPYL